MEIMGRKFDLSGAMGEVLAGDNKCQGDFWNHDAEDPVQQLLFVSSCCEKARRAFSQQIFVKLLLFGGRIISHKQSVYRSE